MENYENMVQQCDKLNNKCFFEPNGIPAIIYWLSALTIGVSITMIANFIKTALKITIAVNMKGHVHSDSAKWMARNIL